MYPTVPINTFVVLMYISQFITYFVGALRDSFPKNNTDCVLHMFRTSCPAPVLNFYTENVPTAKLILIIFVTCVQ